MMTSRQFAIAFMVAIGLLTKSLIGCSSDTGSHVADAGGADAGKDKAGVAGAGGLGETGGQAGTGGAIDAGMPSSGGGGGRGGAAGSSAGGGGGAVDGGGLSGSGGACASFRMCDLEDQTLGYGPGYDVSSPCPVEHECYYLSGSCGPTACVLRAGAHCDDPLACDPGDSPTDDDPKCFAAHLCYQKSLCGKSVVCRRSIDGGAPLDVAADGATPVDVALEAVTPVDVALDRAAPVDVDVDVGTTLDTWIDGSTVLLDGAACNPEEEYQRRYVAYSLAVCATIRYACPDVTTGFQNDCGCGCEQSSSCPQYVNCMPGPGDSNPLCDLSSGDCPYTVRAE